VIRRDILSQLEVLKCVGRYISSQCETLKWLGRDILSQLEALKWRYIIPASSVKVSGKRYLLS
jgi:hypothetical protein